MGYVDQNLITDETVTYRAQLHWILFITPILIATLIDAVAALILVYVGGFEAVAVGMMVVSVTPVFVAFIERSGAEFAVTNKRVILKTGVINKKTAEMFLNKIESVGVDQSVMGRILGYGTITIRGTGGTLEPFDRISSPLEFRRQIQEQVGKL